MTSLTSEEMNMVCASLIVIQRSGIYNMITELGEALTCGMCILSMWEQKSLVVKLNNTNEWMNIAKEWMGNYVSKHDIWKNIADSIPLGPGNLELIKKYQNVMKKSTNENKANMILDFIEKNNFNFDKGLAVYSMDECLKKGYFLRDVVEVKSLAGVHELHLLKAAGAQVLQ
jgi:hypothetical protein